MLAARERIVRAMDLRRIIPSDITASAIAHLSLLTLILLFSDVHPFGAVTAEQIPVEIVTPQDTCRETASCRAACRRENARTGSSANAAARFLRARQACGCECTSAVGAAANCGATAEAGCPGRSACGPAASRRSAATTTGRAGLQDARARSVDQVSGAARAATGICRQPRRRKRVTRAATISTRRRPRRPISPAVWSGNSGGTSRPA